MSETKVGIAIDPRKAQEGLKQIAEEAKKLTEAIEESLGKKSPEAMDKMENAAEKGTNKITAMFRNLGKRVKEDLKTAFDLGAVAEGLKFGNKINEGIKQVFEMERAFDRLNTRLGLTNDKMNQFKQGVGRAVAGTGQKLEDVLPGVEAASSRGNIKDPQQLTAIAEALGRAKAITGEGTEGLSGDVVEILKNQGKQVNAQSFKATLDALEGTRIAGAFKTAGEAGSAIKELAPYAQKLGLNTRDLGGLAAQASKSGPAGQAILQQLLEKGTTVGGQQQINAALGSNVFKNGKLNASALKGVNTERFGQYSQQILQEATGISGANGADLKRFIDTFKQDTSALDKVAQGANETANQFAVATDNLASQFDQFEESVKEGAREVGGSLSKAIHSIFKGDLSGAGTNLKDAGKSAWENKGSLLAALGMTAGVGVLAGGGLRSLLGTGKGLVGGEIAKAAGVQPVYVVNAAEIGGGGGAGDLLKTGIAGGGALATAARFAGGAALAGTAGYAVGTGINSLTGNDGSLGEKLYDWLHPEEKTTESVADNEKMKKAVADGIVEGMQKAKNGQRVQMTNPSNLSGGRGG